MRASLIITAKDQASAALGKVAAGAKRMGAAFKPVAKDAHAADMAIDRVGGDASGRFARIGAAARKMAGDFRSSDRSSTLLGRGLDKVGRTARAGATHITSWASRVRKAATDMRIAERAAYGMGYGIGWSVRKMGGLALGAGKWAASTALTTAKWGAGLGAAAAGWFVGGIIRTGSTFEQFQAQLEGTEGSAQKAKAALAWVAKFAAQTPYQLDEVTDAFVRARGVGIDPLTGAMTKMGDAAAANRKTLMDAVEAIADAQTGEFERLKAFNITTAVKGNTVAFSYIDKAGKNAVRSTKKTAKDIQAAVLSIWDERHGGAMIRQSTTLAGIWSNLQDWVMGFQYRIAGKGIFDRIKNSLADLLDTANRLADDGTLDRWAQRISDRLSEAWDWGVRFVKGIDWASVATGMGSIVSTLATIVGWIGKAANEWRKWQIEVAIRQQENIASGWFTSPTDKAQARTQLFRLRMSKQELEASDAPKVEVRGSGAKWLGNFGQKSATATKVSPWKPSTGNASPWTRSGALAKPVPSTKAPLKPGATAVSPWKPINAPAKQISSVQRIVNDVKVGGRVGIEVKVKAPAGTTVRTTELASANRDVPIDLKTGRAMSEAA